jgi:hypothetical protein
MPSGSTRRRHHPSSSATNTNTQTNYYNYYQNDDTTNMTQDIHHSPDRHFVEEAAQGTSNNDILRSSNNNTSRSLSHDLDLEVEMQPLSGKNVPDKDVRVPYKDNIKGLDLDLDSALEDHELDSNGPERILYPRAKPEHWQQRLEYWLFPPHVPRACQLLRPENIAIPACYLMVGLLQGLSSPLINVFPLHLGATEAQQTTISSIRSLPASFKLIFGFISDNFPMGGYRRKPYMWIGWLMASVSLLLLILFSNTHLAPRDAGCFHGDTDKEDAATTSPAYVIPSDAPSIPLLSLALLGFGTGFWMADVMGDSVVAEKAKLEPPDSRGSIQSTCYSFRFFGIMVAAPLSTYLYATYGPFVVILLLSLLPLTMIPLICIMYEPSNIPIKPTREQCGEIWQTVCSRSVWQPMGVSNCYYLQYK